MFDQKSAMSNSEPGEPAEGPFRPSWPGAFAVAWQGIRHAFQTQRNLRVHAALAVVVIALAALLRVSAVEWCCLLLCLGLMGLAEMMNTAVEVVVDQLSPNWSEGARRAKDVAAGGVLIAAAACAVVGSILFLPRLWALLP